MSITMQDIKSIKDDLAKHTPAKLAVDRELSIKEIIFKLAPDLNRMKRRGFTTDELVKHLAAHGINIKGETLNRYLSDYQNTRKPAKNQDAASRPKKDKAPKKDTCNKQVAPERPLSEGISTSPDQSINH